MCKMIINGYGNGIEYLRQGRASTEDEQDCGYLPEDMYCNHIMVSPPGKNHWVVNNGQLDRWFHMNTKIPDSVTHPWPAAWIEYKNHLGHSCKTGLFINYEETKYGKNIWEEDYPPGEIKIYFHHWSMDKEPFIDPPDVQPDRSSYTDSMNFRGWGGEHYVAYASLRMDGMGNNLYL